MANRLLIGDFGGGDYRIRRSRFGKDVTANLNPEDLALDSAWKDTGIVITKGSVFVSRLTSTSGLWLTIPLEAMPIRPIVIMYQKRGATNYTSGQPYIENPNVFLPRSFVNITDNSLLFQRPNVDAGIPEYTASYIVLRGMPNG